MDTTITDIRITVFNDIIEKAVKSQLNNNQVLGILLFGSVAKGTAKHNSDIDLLVLRNNTSFHVEVDEIDGVPIKIVVFPADIEVLKHELYNEQKQGRSPTFSNGIILYDKEGLLDNYCKAVEQTIIEGPTVLSNEEYEHIRVGMTELLGDIKNSYDLHTLKLLSNNFIITGLKYYYRIKRWWIPALKHQLSDLSIKDTDLYYIVSDVLSIRDIDAIKDRCEQFTHHILKDLGGTVIYSPGKEYYI